LVALISGLLQARYFLLLHLFHGSLIT